jgi:hypothetical protein
VTAVDPYELQPRAQVIGAGIVNLMMGAWLVAAPYALGYAGAEALLLLGFDRQQLPIRSALRRISVLISELEERSTAGVGAEVTWNVRPPN